MHVQSSVFIRICPKGWYRRIAERSVSYLSKGGERCVCCVEEEEEVMLVTNKGKLIRLPVNGIRVAGRVTQGVTLLNTENNENTENNQ